MSCKLIPPFCPSIPGGFTFSTLPFTQNRLGSPSTALHFLCFLFLYCIFWSNISSSDIIWDILQSLRTIALFYPFFFLHRTVYCSFVWLKLLKNWLLLNIFLIWISLSFLVIEMNANEIFTVVCGWASQSIQSLNHSSLVCKYPSLSPSPLHLPFSHSLLFTALFTQSAHSIGDSSA